ncbi:2Fe-2S iron-sulfur cluster-binding protein [Nodosilinea nodulosa]|uniref:2Fe-2S iron-sulfur cluster-binding protein n=1 Tax=Nodosilinea nodulosa TaxID=416001 RepID=UPI0002EAE1C0|nr:2Fe-2S iron-sulfur cluster-binding protein [Nodosilinea nodulosa]
MADILERIPNPFWRSTQAAVMGASATGILAAGLLGLAKIDDGLLHRLTLYGSLVGAGAGAVFGLVGVKPRLPETRVQPQASTTWQDWRNFVVERKVPESQEITSFYLKPLDGGALPGFVPGQFLTIRLPIPGQPRPVIRTYSLSDYADDPAHYRLSIKREGPPKDRDVPPGVASHFMHDQVQAGSIIEAKPPAGKFVLDVLSPRPAVLISNGVGITPMISMAKAVSQRNPARPLWFLHGARDGSYHAFRDEVGAIAAQTPSLKVHYCYSRPRPDDASHYHSTGYVDAELIQTLLPVAPADADYFLCGSPSFMDSLRSGLMALGVPPQQIRFESFAKAAPTAKAAVDPAAVNSAAVDPIGAAATAEVVFAKSGKTATWTPADGTLLEFAEDQGLEPDYSCRAGICLTCMCRLESGEVAYEEPPTGTPEPGSVLICVSKPQTAQVVLDL